MSVKKNIVQTLLVGAYFGLVGQSAFAVNDESGVYVGVSHGQVGWDIDSVSVDETSKSIFLGYEVNPYISLELGYNDFGVVSDNTTNVSYSPVSNRTYTSIRRSNIDITSITLSGILSIPVGDFSFYFQGGAEQWDSEFNVVLESSVISNNQIVSESSSPPFKGTDDSLGGFYSLGFKYAFTNQLSAFGQYAVRKRKDDFDITPTAISLELKAFNIGAIYSF